MQVPFEHPIYILPCNRKSYWLFSYWISSYFCCWTFDNDDDNYNYDYERMTSTMSILKDDIIEKAFHPKRVISWIEQGYDPSNMV